MSADTQSSTTSGSASPHVDALNGDIANVEAVVNELQVRLQKKQSELKRLRAAVSILTKEPTAAKPAPTKELVEKIVVAVLNQTGRVALDQLTSTVEREVLKREYTRMGLKLRLNEVLSDDAFDVTEEFVQLKKEAE